IAGEVACLAPALRDGGGHGLAAIVEDVEQRHRRPFTREGSGDALALPLRGPGDERHLAIESSYHVRSSFRSTALRQAPPDRRVAAVIRYLARRRPFKPLVDRPVA